MSGPTDRQAAERRRRDAIAQVASNIARNSGGTTSNSEAERLVRDAVNRQERIERSNGRT